jgi:hypothetical protein
MMADKQTAGEPRRTWLPVKGELSKGQFGRLETAVWKFLSTSFASSQTLRLALRTAQTGEWMQEDEEGSFQQD